MSRVLFFLLLICALTTGCRTGGSSRMTTREIPVSGVQSAPSASTQFVMSHSDRPRVQFTAIGPGQSSVKPRMATANTADRIPLPESSGGHLRRIDPPRRTLATGIGSF